MLLDYPVPTAGTFEEGWAVYTFRLLFNLNVPLKVSILYKPSFRMDRVWIFEWQGNYYAFWSDDEYYYRCEVESP